MKVIQDISPVCRVFEDILHRNKIGLNLYFQEILECQRNRCQNYLLLKQKNFYIIIYLPKFKVF